MVNFRDAELLSSKIQIHELWPLTEICMLLLNLYFQCLICNRKKLIFVIKNSYKAKRVFASNIYLFCFFRVSRLRLMTFYKMLRSCMFMDRMRSIGKYFQLAIWMAKMGSYWLISVDATQPWTVIAQLIFSAIRNDLSFSDVEWINSVLAMKKTAVLGGGISLFNHNGKILCSSQFRFYSRGKIIR